MPNRFIADLSLKWKMILAAILPIVSLSIFATIFSFQQFSHAGVMKEAAQLATYTQTISELVHELQKERGRTAGFVASGGKESFAKLLSAQITGTDRVIKTYTNASEEFSANLQDDIQSEHAGEIFRHLDELAAHRAKVKALLLTGPEAVTPYTETINNLIFLASDNSNNSNVTEISSASQGLLALMRAKESAGLERAAGSAALASGQMPHDRHSQLLALIAQQSSLFEQFKGQMPIAWSDRLEAIQGSSISREVADARYVLTDAGYGGALSGYTSADWFSMTTQRIDELMVPGSRADRSSEIHIHSGEKQGRGACLAGNYSCQSGDGSVRYPFSDHGVGGCRAYGQGLPAVWTSLLKEMWGFLFPEQSAKMRSGFWPERRMNSLKCQNSAKS